MAGSAPPASAETERTRNQATGVVDRTYLDIVVDQFQRNKLALFGLRVIVCLILVAVFAPFLANSRPILFHGYRYKSYLEGYDQLVYAHSDLFGIGRGGKPLRVPGLYEEGINLPGLGAAYQREIAAWDGESQTWKQIRDVSFGDAEPLMNRLRGRLEEEVPKLKKDFRWARGAVSVTDLRKHSLPEDIRADLDKLIGLARQNLDQNYQAKAELRQRSLLQQFKLLEAEVSSTDREAIEGFAKRYASAIQAGFHTRAPDSLGEFDTLLLEIRERLAPNLDGEGNGVTFRSHWDAPAIWQLEWRDVAFMLLVICAGTLPLWGRFVTGERPQVTHQRRAAVVLLVPVLAAGAWGLFVPSYNDTTDYRAGMLNGDLFCSFRLMAPLRYGVNENDPNRKWTPPWWLPWKPNAGAEQEAAEQKARDQAAALRKGSEMEQDLAELKARVAKLRTTPEGSDTGWAGVLDFLNRNHMGTDGTGRDLMTRMIWGSRISLSIGFVAVGIYVLIGVFVGALAGYFGGWVDMIISRVIEIVICFPTFFLILTVIAFLGSSIWNIMLVIGFTGWPGVARLVRGEFFRLRNRDFVTAGKALGFSDARVIFRHVLPNALAPVLVAATFGVASAILVESSLSFLGFGVKVPTPTWGSVLSSARESWIYWWITIFPGFAIFLTVTMYNLVGEGIRDAVDPKLRK